ncbi:hypothetical protein LAJ19_12215 [Deinococcus taeanensis]|uniref:hypothetical protein n=1 Tax=Deinococcus taeanensis TaxID=2737050 RepID=UPI001CDC58BC|nr:hypothetical protein [Deinococcus taeanensis]UBV42378.1 hypothetical protein LAJ19_12215 [Deinococcus taeanensis]
MTRTARLARFVTLSVALGISAAGAQNLAAYTALASSLEGAVQARATSAQAALTRLDAAGQALEQLAPTLRNQQIVSGLKDALGASRAALARTPAELEAQVLLARGLMRKALYDQSLVVLAGTPANADAQLRVLAREFGLTGAAAQALTQDARGGHLERAAWRLQRAAAQKVSAALQTTQAQQSTGSYVNLARATSWFTVVQDASGVGTLRLSQFGDALRQLTAGDTAALSASLVTLRAGTQAFTQALATPPAVAGTPATPPPSGSATAAQKPPVTPSPPAATSGRAAPSAAPATGSAVAGAPAVYAALGRALSATSHADGAAARAALQDAAAQLARVGTPLRDTAEFQHLQRALNGVQDRRALRPSDVQALIGGLANAERAAAGERVSALDGASMGTAGWFSGWLRVLIFTLLAAAVAVPLYLLNLAFGGRNTFWRAIMAGLSLLLLPLVLEGLFGLLGALGDLFGGGLLASFTNLTLTQGAYALPIWTLLAAGALGLLAFGFRGLCQQFGLLGDQSGSQSNPMQHTVIDWDEDL